MIIKRKAYIFLDESGKPEVFSAKGKNLVTSGVASRFLVLATVRTDDQLLLQQQVTEFRLSLLKNSELKKIFSPSYSLDSFHAHHDYDIVRENFYGFIKMLDVKIDVLVVEKLLCYETLKQNPGKLYGVMTGQLLKNICHQSESTEVIFSRKDSKTKLRQELEVEVEIIRLEYLQKHPTIQSSLALSYFHNPHYSHGGLQIADYIAYAVFQVFERDNRKWYELVKDKIGKIQDICNKKYFTRSNPL
jgi:hypothetical protein